MSQEQANGLMVLLMVDRLRRKGQLTGVPPIDTTLHRAQLNQLADQGFYPDKETCAAAVRDSIRPGGRTRATEPPPGPAYTQTQTHTHTSTHSWGPTGSATGTGAGVHFRVFTI